MKSVSICLAVAALLWLAPLTRAGDAPGASMEKPGETWLLARNTAAGGHSTGGSCRTERDAADEPRPLLPLIRSFASLTELQQEDWNEKHEWVYRVSGNGTVSEVGKAGFFSEIKEAAYEVTVELSNADRAVLFYPSEQREAVLGLSAGQRVSFKGCLKKIQNWGFWHSAYVRVE